MIDIAISLSEEDMTNAIIAVAIVLGLHVVLKNAPGLLDWLVRWRTK